MSLSFEESKKLLRQQAAMPMMLSLSNEAAMVSEVMDDEAEFQQHPNKTHKWYSQYVDRNISMVGESIEDAKIISMDPHQINLSQESNSQYIPFEMARYYDGIDLAKAEHNMLFMFHYMRPDGEDGVSNAVNVRYSDTRIRFGWLVDSAATLIDGKLLFEIIIEGVIKTSATETLKYVWKSRTNEEMTILKSIHYNEIQPVEIPDNWFTKIQEEVLKAETAATSAETAAKEAAETLKAAVDTLELTNYDTKEEVNTKISDSEKKTTQWVQDNYHTAETVNASFAKLKIDFNKDTQKLSLAGDDGTTQISETDIIIDGLADFQASYNTEDEIISFTNTGKTQKDEYGQDRTDNDGNLIYEEIGSITLDISSKIATALESYYTTAEIDGLTFSFDNTTKKLTMYKPAAEGTDPEVLTSVDIDINGLAKLDVTFDKVNSTLTFLDTGASEGDQIIKEVPLNIDGLANFEVAYDAESEVITFTNNGEFEDAPNTEVNPVTEGEDNQTQVPKTIGTIDLKITEKVDAKVDVVKKQVDDLSTDLNTKIDDLSKDFEEQIGNIDVSSQLTGINNSIEEIREDISSIENADKYRYYATYGAADHMFNLWEVKNDDTSTKVSVGTFPISGGGGNASNIQIEIVPITAAQNTISVEEDFIIDYKVLTYGASGVIKDGTLLTATWKIGSKTLATEEITSSQDTEYHFDVTKYLVLNKQTITLEISEPVTGSVLPNYWSVTVLDLKVTADDFDDTATYWEGTPVKFSYKPSGKVNKTVHFEIDGGPIEHSVNHTQYQYDLSYDFFIPNLLHGVHSVRVYVTAQVTESGSDAPKTISSDSIYKDIIVRKEGTTDTLIACSQSNFTAKQYETTDIKFTVDCPTQRDPVVNLKSTYIDDEGVEQTGTTSTIVLKDGNTDTWSFKTGIIGEHTLTIECEGVTKTIKATITDLGLNIDPVITNLALDFNPIELSNNSENRLWSNGTYNMSVSDNFDWINGGYQQDKDNNSYFCIKAGTYAIFDYKLFNFNHTERGEEFKLVFKTENVKNRSTSFLTCLHSNIGLDMHVENAYIETGMIDLYDEETDTTSRVINHLDLPYCEEEIIEFEFNIKKWDNPDSGRTYLMTYEDGNGYRALEYDKDTSLNQGVAAKPIYIGSNDCDVLIYRMKVYNEGLTDVEILNNFIMDARTPEEMVARYNRNQSVKILYTESEDYTKEEYIEQFAEANPQLRIIMLESPIFTKSKEDKVKNSNVRYIHKGGDKKLDNWVCVNMIHSGQGTSSDAYGQAGRNLDLRMDKSDASLYLDCHDIETADFSSYTKSENQLITLTRQSVPVNYLNIKVNIASSENQNNKIIAKRFNQFNPYQNRPAKVRDSKVKDTMEFYNCVVFIRETSEVLSEHQEFPDNNWHFYALGNVGDSKKTDYTRVDYPNDKNEFIVEINDCNLPLSEFPSGKGKDRNSYIAEYNRLKAEDPETYRNISVEEYISKHSIGYVICPPEEWDNMDIPNSARDSLNAAPVFKDGEFDTFGNGTYSFRYEIDGMEKGTYDPSSPLFGVRDTNIQRWKELYRFIVTSSNEYFKEHFGDYFIVESALYDYLVTERYIMVDNRAKNSFWHYSKKYVSEAEKAQWPYCIVDNTKAAINNGYRWDLCFDYDNDTSLGIDNAGGLTMTFGVEDVDKDSAGNFYFRAAESMFFSRIRSQFSVELDTMYKDLASTAFNAESLIREFDKAQSEFPEDLCRLDYQRKYIRSYKNGFTLFLKKMMNGKKKYQRRQFERNQDIYVASKHKSIFATDDFILMRFSPSPNPDVVTANYDITVVPYSDMYICYSYADGHQDNFRVKGNQEYTIKYPFAVTGEDDKADITKLYPASYVKGLSDLSRCYIGYNEFSTAKRLQTLKLGSSDPGYYNTSLQAISLDNCYMLEKLDIQNTKGFTENINLVNCRNLQEFYAKGSAVVGVTFCDGGRLKEAELPSVSRLVMKNLSYLEKFTMDSSNNLTRLIVENTPIINTYSIVESALSETNVVTPQQGAFLYYDIMTEQFYYWDGANFKKKNQLLNETVTMGILKNGVFYEIRFNTLRLKGFDWDRTYNIYDTSILEKLRHLSGVDDEGIDTTPAFLEGKFHARKSYSAQKLIYKQTWPELTITEDESVTQWLVEFKNADEQSTLIDTQYVTNGETPIDPRNKEGFVAPTIPNTDKFEYVFVGWNAVLSPTFNHTIYTAIYEPRLRKYTVTYKLPASMGNGELKRYEDREYGSVVNYDGEIPTYPTDEGAPSYKFYLFDHWDKSGYVDGDKVIEAVFDSCQYVDGYFNGKDLSTLKPVEIYMMVKMGVYQNSVKAQDALPTITLGRDYHYDDIEDEVLIGTKTVFNGTDSKHDTNIALMETDRSFVLAIDFEFGTTNTTDKVLMQCFDGYNSNGFKLSYNGGPRVYWGDSQTAPATGSNREMLVIRHIAGEVSENGEPILYVYTSNLSANSSSDKSLTAVHSMLHNETLIFGCSKETDINGNVRYGDYAAGTIYWSKIWYGDLGDKICKELVSWTHEEVNFEMAGFDGYYIGDNSRTKTAMTFVASNLLSQSKSFETDNRGGWYMDSENTTSTCYYLNNRVYNAFPIPWRQLIKPIQIKSFKITTDAGREKLEPVTSNHYVTIPSINELYHTQINYQTVDGMGDGVYETESGSNNIITFSTNEASRICRDIKGNPKQYMTRSPHYGTAYMWVIGNISGGSANYGAPYGYCIPSNPYGIRMMISI